MTSCLPLSVFWFRLNEGRADGALCLLTDYFLLEFCCLSENLGHRGHLSIITAHSPYTKACDYKAKFLHIPICFPLGCAPKAKKSLAFAKNSQWDWVCMCVHICVCVLHITDSVTVPKGPNTALKFLFITWHFFQCHKIGYELPRTW